MKRTDTALKEKDRRAHMISAKHAGSLGTVHLLIILKSLELNQRLRQMDDALFSKYLGAAQEFQFFYAGKVFMAKAERRGSFTREIKCSMRSRNICLPEQSAVCRQSLSFCQPAGAKTAPEPGFFLQKEKTRRIKTSGLWFYISLPGANTADAGSRIKPVVVWLIPHSLYLYSSKIAQKWGPEKPALMGFQIPFLPAVYWIFVLRTAGDN